MMERRMVLALIMVVAVGVWCLAAGVSPAQVKSPADLTFDQGKASPGKVTFSHGKHIVDDAKCTTCHVKVFKMKKGSTDTSGGAMHKDTACGTCHNGKKSFAVGDKNNCVKCHKK
jgi:c(7)-type cytochrome triheme protein